MRFPYFFSVYTHDLLREDIKIVCYFVVGFKDIF